MTTSSNLIPYLMSGVLFLVVGFIIKNIKIKKINMFVGYRTCRSMANQENWDNANKFYPNTMIKSGVFLILEGIVVYSIFPESDLVIFLNLLIMPIITIVYMIFSTEKHLNIVKK